MAPKRLFSLSALLFLVVLCGAQFAAAQDAIKITDGPKIESVKDTTAVIAWTTNAAASAVVRYGTDRNNLSQSAQQAWGGTENASGNRTHRVELKNLKPGTAYFFQVESGQAKGTGTVAKADVMNFTTPAAGASATTAQSSEVKITDGPRIEYVDDNSAVIAWTTSVPTSAVVHYGTDRNNLSQTSQQGWGGAENASGRRTHRVQVRNLQANTDYFFQVESGQAKGTGAAAKSDVMNLKTLTKEAAAENYRTKQNAGNFKIQAGPIPQSVKDTSASLWLMTSEDAPVVVKYGTDRNNLNQTAQSPTGKEHSLQLVNLQPSTTYFYSVDVGSGKATEKGQFQTEQTRAAGQTPRVYLTKGPVIEYINRQNAVVAWSTNVRASSIVRYGTDANNLNMTAQAPWGQETHRVEIKNLKPNTKYFFVLESAQAEGSGTLAKSNSAPFTTVAEGQQAMRNPEQR